MLARETTIGVLLNLAITGLFIFWLVTMSIAITFCVSNRIAFLALLVIALIAAVAGSISVWSKHMSDKWTLVGCSFTAIPGFFLAVFASDNLPSKVLITGSLVGFIALTITKLSTTKYVCHPK